MPREFSTPPVTLESSSGPGVATVLIGGQPAAVIGDSHTCGMPPAPTGAGPHPPTTIVKGSKTVLIGGRPPPG